MSLSRFARLLRTGAFAEDPWPERIAGCWPELQARAALIAALPPEQSERLRKLCVWFLTHKAITPARDYSLDDDQRILIAALCCLPVLHLGPRWLRDWAQVIVYPNSFVTRRHGLDEDSGVVSEWEEELAGEAWEFGPLLLSWADIVHDLEDPHAGYQLVAHEIAHKLDALDGVLDGTPPLPAARRMAWIRDFQYAYDDLRRRVECGQRTSIDEYAATSVAEFFAVTSEYHFSAPALLARAMPAVAAHLRDFYAASPLLNARSGNAT